MTSVCRRHPVSTSGLTDINTQTFRTCVNCGTATATNVNVEGNGAPKPTIDSMLKLLDQEAYVTVLEALQIVFQIPDSHKSLSNNDKSKLDLCKYCLELFKVLFQHFLKFVAASSQGSIVQTILEKNRAAKRNLRKCWTPTGGSAVVEWNPELHDSDSVAPHQEQEGDDFGFHMPATSNFGMEESVLSLDPEDPLAFMKVDIDIDPDAIAHMKVEDVDFELGNEFFKQPDPAPEPPRPNTKLKGKKRISRSDKTKLRTTSC